MKIFVVYKRVNLANREEVGWQFASVGENQRLEVISSVGYQKRMSLEDFARHVAGSRSENFLEMGKLTTVSPFVLPKSPYIEEGVGEEELGTFVNVYRARREERRSYH